MKKMNWYEKKISRQIQVGKAKENLSICSKTNCETVWNCVKTDVSVPKINKPERNDDRGERQ